MGCGRVPCKTDAQDRQLVGLADCPAEGFGDLQQMKTNRPILQQDGGRGDAVEKSLLLHEAQDKKIESQVHELQFWRESTLDREDRIGVLKNEVNEVLQEAGRPPRYTDPEVLKKDFLPINPPPSDSEQERLATLRRYNVLDSPAEKDFDDVVALAAQICGTPIALVSLVDEKRQWFKAAVGLAATETSREISFCAHAIQQRDLFVVPDSLLDDRFVNNPLVTGEVGLRFYAGSPLIAPNGKVLGALCVIDRKPRRLNSSQVQCLSVLSRHVMTLLDLRQQGGEMARTNQALLSILEDERRARAAVRDSQDQIAEQTALLNKARDAIVIRDIDGKITYWNRGAERIHGWSREEVLGRDISKKLYPNPKVINNIYKLFMDQDEWAGEVAHLTKDGREIIVQVHATLIRDDEGHPRSMLEINTDITEKKKIEAQFMRAQRMESIHTMAGGIAHDLNNILSPIMMSIESLQKTSDDPRTESLLQTIAASAKRGAEIVRQVLSFSQGVEGERVTLDYGDLLMDLEHIIKDTFPKDIRLKFSVLKETWKIMGDPTQVHQVLLNLCLNARDAMRNGGTLTVSAENCVLDEQYASMNIQAKPGRFVKIAVADTGGGLPPKVVDRIFEPFFATQDLDDGTGLRLSTVMAIVKSHGGSISVDSEPGNGTTFNVYLPIMETAAEVRKGNEEPREWPRGKGETILVVDDEAPILTVTSQTLRKFGYEVLTATDGANAVSIYAERQDEIAVVLTDVMMPIMDGPAMVHALREINPSIKVIVASGLNTKSDMTGDLGSGAKYVLIKPYTSATLLTTLRSILDES